MAETLVQGLDEFLAVIEGDLEPDEKIARIDEMVDGIRGEMLIADVQRTTDMATSLLEFAEKANYVRGRGYAVMLLGFADYLISDHESALQKQMEALSILESVRDDKGIARAFNFIAGSHLSLGNYEQALSYAFRSLKLSESIDDVYLRGWCLNGIGTAYQELGDLNSALDFHKQSLKLFIESGHKVGHARSLTGIGTVYQSLGQYEEALKCHEESLGLFKAWKNEFGRARALTDIGIIHQRLGDLKHARNCHLEALEIRHKIGNRQSETTSLYHLGQIYLEQNDTHQALDVLNKALNIAREIKVKPRVYHVLELLALTREKLGDTKQALQYQKEFHRVKEEVFSDETTSRLKNLQVSFEIEKSEKEAQIERLKNVELKGKNVQLKRLLDELKAAQVQLIQSEKMAALGMLVAGVVHEMNNPVGAINSSSDVTRRCVSGLISKLESAKSIEELSRDDGFNKLLKTLQDNNEITLQASHRVSRIVGSLKSFARLDQADVEKVDVHQNIEDTLVLLRQHPDKKICVEKDFGEIPKITCYPGELNQVLMNLLVNASEAIEKSGTISIKTRADKDNVSISISDNGVGIAEQQLSQLFDPSFTKKGSRVKAGMGLFTSYNIINKHHGEIKVSSKVGEGSTFEVILPTSFMAK